MAYEDKSEKLSEEQEGDLLEKAQEQWEICDNHFSEQYEQAKDDWDFLHGIGQWDVGALDVRNKDGRPSLVLNQLLPYAHQITNDIKQARLAIRVVPIDSRSDIEVADVRAGIIRNIEKQSKAKNVYGTAAMNAIGAGIGWVRIRIDYADNDTFEQEAFIERVLDFTSIYLDPRDTSLDGSCAEYGFDFEKTTYSLEQFAELYPDDAAVSFAGISREGLDEKDEVTLVEYYYKECEKTTLHEIEVQGELFQLTSKELKVLDEAETVYEKVRSREIEESTVYHCVLSGEAVLSREVFPCHYIPLVPVIGEEFFSNGKREFKSLIDQAKDSQRMYNYWKSESVGMMALQPKAPWIAPVGSFQSYPDKWTAANTQSFAFLEYDVVRDEDTGQMLPPPIRTQPIQGSPAMMQEAVSARDDIRLSLGIPQSNMGERSNAVSGIAIRTQQIEGDNATFHFIDNLSTSISQVGRILNDIIPSLYSDRKIARIIGDDGEQENVPVNVPYVKDENGLRAARAGEEAHGVYDLSVGKYDIDLDVGASYSSKRQEMADKLIELIGIKPEIADVTADLVVEALDLPMSKEIAERIKSTMDPALLGDDPQAAKLQEASSALQKMQEQLANYEAALEDKGKNEDFEKATKAEEMQLERDKFEVDAEKTKADIDKIYADIQGESASVQSQGNISEIMAGIEGLVARVDDLGQTIEFILDDIETDIDENVANVIEVEEMETPEPLETTGEMLDEGENE